MDAVKDSGSSPSDTFWREMEERFERSQGFESSARTRFLSDMRFAHGDSENHWQWDEVVRKQRATNDKPFLTINKTRQHNLQIVNDAKQNKPSITMRPTGAGASYKAALMHSGLARYIEYRSNAQAIYDQATNFMVNGGVGYWRVITEYSDDEGFDQDIRIKSIPDPLCVLIDPDAIEPDRCDMNFAFIFESMSKDLAKQKHPQYREEDSNVSLGLNPQTPFQTPDSVTMCEYYKRVWEEDTLYKVEGGATFRASTLDEEALEMVSSSPNVKSRSLLVPRVEWYLTVGRSILDSKIVPGRNIPVVQIAAEEIRIDGIMDRKSHTRMLKDPQRMYNYWSSSAVEFGALQTKTPWAGPAEAFEGHETLWERANRDNLSYLPYNAYDDNGQKLDPPQRVAPPMSAPVALDGMKVAQMEFMLVSGQYDNQMGQQGNERTGKAINARQRKSDNATYHYVDALAIGVQYTGKIILDMIPIIYDTERTLMILGPDNVAQELQINPQMTEAYTEKTGPDGKPTNRMLNPKVGKYQVQADTGPGYATKRQEAFDAFAVIITQNPTIASLIGDIMLREGDFPGADEAAERLKRMVPKAALGEGPSQEEQAFKQQVDAMQSTIQALMDQLIIAESKLVRQGEKTGVEKYKAFTERVKVVLDSEKTAAELKLEFVRMLSDFMAVSAETEASPPGEIVAGAKAGPNPRPAMLGINGGGQ